jgi:hypothetical protein
MDTRSKRIERRLEPLIIVATLLVVPVLLLQRAEVEDPGARSPTSATG